MLSATVDEFATVGAAVVGVADVSAATVLSAGAGSFCGLRGVGPLCPEPRSLPPRLRYGLGFAALVSAVATEADIVQGEK